MNPELADRLRRFGDTVDQAAIAAQARRDAEAGPPSHDQRDGRGNTDELPTVVPISAGPNRRRFRSITAAAAAAVVVAAAAAIVAVLAGPSDARPAASTEVTIESMSRPTTTSTAPPTTVVAVPLGSDVATTATASSTTNPAPTSVAAGAPSTTPRTCPNGYDPYPARYPIRACHEGPAVELIQSITGAPVDGLFGPATRQSVRVFQERHGLNPDGLVGPMTWAAMFPNGAPGVDADGNGVVDPWELG
jgi:peptidoglycan hydrolase-like protein with peptidoglycan-binding domain